MKIFVCSSVNTEYNAYLVDCIRIGGYEADSIYSISESAYRAGMRATGVRRKWMRLQMYVVYPVNLAWKVITGPGGACYVVSSNTFYAPLVVTLFARVRRARVVHHLYDLFPDAIEVAGGTRVDSWLSKVLGFIARSNQRRCDAAVYLGAFLRAHAERRWGSPRDSRVIPIAADYSLFFTERKERVEGVPLVMHYGGQLGYMHDAETLEKALLAAIAHEEISRDYRFKFNLSGAMAARMHEVFDGGSLDVEPTVAAGKWREIIRDYHIGLVALSPGGATVCLPSKTYAMMAGGLAIVAVCPRWSDLADLILDHDAGWVVNNSPYCELEELEGEAYLEKVTARRPVGDVAEEFVATLLSIRDSPDVLESRRANAMAAMREYYSKEATAGSWREFLGELSDPTQAEHTK